MNKTKKKNRKKVDTVKSVNNSIRTSVRKLNPILKPWSSVTIILSESKQMENDGSKS